MSAVVVAPPIPRCARLSARVGAGLLIVAVASITAATVPAAAATPPARIVSLTPSHTETLFALGVGARVVAVSTYCDYPPEATRLPKIGSFLAPSVEAIVAERPDVVVGAPSPGNHEAVAALRRLGIRVDISDAEHLADVPALIRGIAASAGVPEEGERLVARVTAEIDAVRRRVAGEPRRRVLMAIGQDPLIAVGPASFLGELLADAGGENVAPPGTAWPHVNVEYVIARDPEVILDTSMGTEEGSSLDFWLRYPSLAAVRSKRVQSFRSYRVLRPGPRLGAGLEDLARIIHPEAWR